MKSEDFNDFLEQCRKMGGKEGAAAILFQLSREEMETNSQYAAALRVIKDILGAVYTNQMETFFKAVMQDENDHSLKFQWAASELTGIKVGRAEHVGQPIK